MDLIQSSSEFQLLFLIEIDDLILEFSNIWGSRTIWSKTKLKLKLKEAHFEISKTFLKIYLFVWGHTCKANLNVLVLLVHPVGPGIELNLSGLAPGAFTCWAILLALHFQRLSTKQGWFKHIYKHRFVDNCKRT